jgi:hypothetical protein
MRMIPIVALLSFSMLVGCATSSNIARPGITIERTSCYGSCPVYRFTQFSDGHYLWVGRAHVAVWGTVSGSGGARAYAVALQLLRDARYLDFKDDYAQEDCEVFATDNLTVRIVVEDALGSKTITHYRGCEGFPPQDASSSLEESLDKVLGTRRFTGGDRMSLRDLLNGF